MEGEKIFTQKVNRTNTLSKGSETMNEIMGVSEIARLLKTRNTNVKRMFEKGIIPGVKVNERGDWRTHRDNVEELLRGKRSEVKQ